MWLKSWEQGGGGQLKLRGGGEPGPRDLGVRGVIATLEAEGSLEGI